MLRNAKELLRQYYQPLISYNKEKNAICGLSSNELTAPLWRIRQICLQDSQIIEQLKIAKENDNQISLVLRLTCFCLETETCFSELPDVDQINLLNILELPPQFSRDLIIYATSLIVTLFLREGESGRKKYREFAWALLKEGRREEELEFTKNRITRKVNLKLADTNLLSVDFINFSHINLNDLLLENFNFSHQYLKGIKKNNSVIKNCKFCYAYLPEASFEKSKFGNCDFTGANLWNANFRSTTVKDTHFDEANLYKAIFENATLKRIFFNKSNMSAVNFKNGSFVYSDFRYAVGLNVGFLTQAKSLEGSDFNAQNDGLTRVQLDNLKISHSIEIDDTTSDNVTHNALTENIELLASLITREKNSSDDATLFPLWPKDTKRWDNKNEFPKAMTFCDLKSEDPTYKLLENFIYMTSDAITYESMRLEHARWKKAYDVGLINAILFFFKDIVQPPKIKGKIGGVNIHKIQINKNPKILENYLAKREQIRNELRGPDPLSGVTWHQESALGLPIINRGIGECLLFHGTSAVSSIQQNGFDTSYCVERFLAGYGPLGKGIYCSDSFAKGHGYAFHACEKDKCDCPPGQEVRVVFIVRAVLGNVLVDKHKSRKQETKIPKNYHTVWGPCQEKNPDSELRQNEFCIPGVAQLYPEYCVYYSINEPKPEEISEIIVSTADIKILEKVPYWPHRIAFNDLKREIKKALINANQLKNTQKDILNSALELILKKEAGNNISTQKLLPHTFFWALDYYDKGFGYDLVLMSNNKLKPNIIEFKCKSKGLKYRVIGLDNGIETGLIGWSDLPLDFPKNGNEIIRKKDSLLSKILKITSNKGHTLMRFFPGSVNLFNQVLYHPITEKALIRLFLYKGEAEAHLEDFEPMVKSFNLVWRIGKAQIEDYLAQDRNAELRYNYYHESLKYLKNTLTSDDEQEHDFVARIARWSIEQLVNNQWDYDAWEKSYWELACKEQRKIFRTTLCEVADNAGNFSHGFKEFADHIPDECGRSRKMEKSRFDFHQDMLNIIQTKVSDVEIRWLGYSKGNYKIKESYFKEIFIKKLFKNNGELHPEEREEEGRSLVKGLKDENGYILIYLKFYPHYPLRQFAVDSFCARLSGDHAETTLAWIKHKNCEFGYPVLFSKPLGQTLLQHEKRENADNFLNRINPHAFTWKFLETLLIRPGDNKSDNLIPTKVPYDASSTFNNRHKEDSYAWVSLDTDVCFKHEAVEKKNVHIFAIEFLLEQMDEGASYTAMLAYIRRDWSGLFDSWLTDLKAYTEALNGDERSGPLFSNDEINYYKSLKNRISIASGLFSKRGYSVDCNITSLFRDNDISRLNESVYEIKMVLQKNILRNQSISTEKISHWHLMQEINYPLCQAYKQVYKKGLPLSLNFQMLPGIDENFQRKTISLKYCSLVLMFDNEMPDQVNSLTIPTSTAWVRVNTQLYYIDILRDKRDLIEINAEDLELFDKKLEIKTLSKEHYSRILKEEELNFIVTLKGCTHITHRLTEETLITSHSKHLIEKDFIQLYSELPNQIAKLKKIKLENYYKKFMALLEGISEKEQLEIIRQPCYVVIEAPFKTEKLKALKILSNTIFIRVKKATEIYYFDKNTDEYTLLSKNKEIVDDFDNKLGIGWFPTYNEPKILTCAELDIIMQITAFKHLISRQFTDLMRGKVINLIHWDRLHSQFSERLIEICHSISFRELTISDCLKLTNSHFKSIMASSPELKYLYLAKCNHVTNDAILNSGNFKNLTKFYLEGMVWKHFSIPDQVNIFPQLKILKITDCKSLEKCVLFFPTLVQLIIKGCENLTLVKINSPYLRKLVIENNFQKLSIVVNNQLVKLNRLIEFNGLKFEDENQILKQVSSFLKEGDMEAFFALIDIKLKEKAIEEFSKAIATEIYTNFDFVWNEILKQLMAEPILTRLILANCKLLTNEILERLLTRNPLLQELDISHCKKLTGNLGPVIALCPKLEVLKIDNTLVEELASVYMNIKLINVRLSVPIELPFLKELYLNHCEKLRSVEINTESLTILEMQNINATLILKGTLLSSPRLARVKMGFPDKQKLPQITLINYCPFLLKEKDNLFQQDDDIISRVIAEFTNVNFNNAYLSANEKKEIVSVIQEVFIFNENLKVIQVVVKDKKINNAKENPPKKVPRYNYDTKTEDELFSVLLDIEGGTEVKESALISIEKKSERISSEKIDELNKVLFTEPLSSIRVQIALLLLKIQGQTDQIIESLTTIATKDYDNQVRRQAVEAMRLLPRPNRRVIDALIEELNITTPDTSALRLEAASSLFEAAKAIDALIAASLNELSKKLKSLNKIPIKYSKRKQEVYIKKHPNSEVLKNTNDDFSVKHGQLFHLSTDENKGKQAPLAEKIAQKSICQLQSPITVNTPGATSVNSLELLFENQPDVNQQYEYEDNDINTILFTRVERLQKKKNNRNKNIVVLAAIDNIKPNLLKKQLIEEKKHNEGARFVLIPCNLGLYHWVGIALEFDEYNNVVNANYIDSMVANPKHRQQFFKEIQAVYPKQQLEIKDFLKQSDTTSCGAYTIENLLIFCGILTIDDRSATDIRKEHLDCLKSHKPDFYERFYQRQRKNRSTVASLSQQMKYLSDLSNIRFSPAEAKRILLAIQFINGMKNQATKVILLAALQPKSIDEDVKEHLDRIRDIFIQILKSENTEDKEKIIALASIFFKQEVQATITYAEMVNIINSAEFSLGHEDIKAIAKLNMVRFENVSKDLDALDKQIQQDEEFARQLQKQFDQELSSVIPIVEPLVSANLKSIIAELVNHQQKSKQFSFKVRRTQPNELCIIFIKREIIMEPQEIEGYLIELNSFLKKDLISLGLNNSQYDTNITMNVDERKLTITAKYVATMNRIGTLLKDAGQNYWTQSQLANSNVFFFKPEKEVTKLYTENKVQQVSDEITCGIQ